MFLNKQDLLKTKVLEGRFKIEHFFPEYSTYQMASDGEWIIVLYIHSLLCLLTIANREPGENEEVRRAKGFIRDLFVVRIN